MRHQPRMPHSTPLQTTHPSPLTPLPPLSHTTPAMSTRPRDAGGQVFRSSVEVYGFVLSITTIISFVLFVLWSFTPEDVLISLGVTYYPSKWWAIAVPSYVFMLFVFIFAFYVAYNMMNTNPLDSYHTITGNSLLSQPHPHRHVTALTRPPQTRSPRGSTTQPCTRLLASLTRTAAPARPATPSPRSSTCPSPKSTASSTRTGQARHLRPRPLQPRRLQQLDHRSRQTS